MGHRRAVGCESDSISRSRIGNRRRSGMVARILEMKLLTTLLFTSLLFGQGLFGQDVKRPRILGVAHMALFVSDIEKSRAFYKDFLGYEEVFLLNKPDGTLSLTFLKINDRQYIELFPQTEAGTERLNHISIETDDAEAMRAYLGSKG